MKKIIILSLLGCMALFTAYSQDTIINNIGIKTICKITREDSTSVYYTQKQGNQWVNSTFDRRDIALIKYGSQIKMNSIETDKCTIGLGFGQVYGGLGGNFLFYPQRNLGIFGGFGYAFAGAGYNVGTKFRFIKENSGSKIIPSIDIMYGYNASIVVANATQYNKLFYGPTIGFGLDIKSTSNRGYLSVDLLIPIRSSEVQSYIDELKNNHGVEFKNSLLPISISVGYRFVLN